MKERENYYSQARRYGKEMWCKRYMSAKGERRMSYYRDREEWLLFLRRPAATSMEVRWYREEQFCQREILYGYILEKYCRSSFKIQKANVILQRQRGMITFSGTAFCYIHWNWDNAEFCFWEIFYGYILEKYCRNIFKIQEANVILQRQKRMITFSGTACCYIHWKWDNALEEYEVQKENVIFHIQRRIITLL